MVSTSGQIVMKKGGAGGFAPNHSLFSPPVKDSLDTIICVGDSNGLCISKRRCNGDCGRISLARSHSRARSIGSEVESRITTAFSRRRYTEPPSWLPCGVNRLTQCPLQGTTSYNFERDVP